MLQLEDVLIRMWRAEIVAMVGLSPPAHIAAIIDLGDGEEVRQDFTADGPPGEIAQWLDAMARKHFGDRYA